MKAISLWQPWASLIAVGAKRFETRSWATRYRGPLLICAAKGGLSKTELCDYLSDWDFRLALAPLKLNGVRPTIPDATPRIWIEDLPFGKAVCIADLVACYHTEEMPERMIDIGQDALFGDFSPGRFAWKLENVRAFKEPFPVRGAQGLFEVDDSLIIGRETVEVKP